MLEYLYLMSWDRTFGFLASGSPPIYVRLLALNALFLAFAGIRRAVAAEPLSSGMMLLAQVVMLAANLFVLYQPEAQHYAMVFMRRF